jgi:hypothetical protein
VISIWLYIYFCMYMLLTLAMWLLNHVYLQDAVSNQDKYGGHLIGDTRLVECVSY